MVKYPIQSISITSQGMKLNRQNIPLTIVYQTPPKHKYEFYTIQWVFSKTFNVLDLWYFKT